MNLFKLLLCTSTFVFSVSTFAFQVRSKDLHAFQGKSLSLKLLKDETHAIVTSSPRFGEVKISFVNLQTGNSLILFEGETRKSSAQGNVSINPKNTWIVLDTGHRSLATAFSVSDLKNGIVNEWPILPTAAVPSTAINGDNFYVNDADKFLFITTNHLTGVSQFHDFDLNTGADTVVMEDKNEDPPNNDDLHFVGFKKGWDPHGVGDAKIGLSTSDDKRRLYDSAIGGFIYENLMPGVYSMNLSVNQASDVVSLVYDSRGGDVIVKDGLSYPFGPHSYPSFGYLRLANYLAYRIGVCKIFDVDLKRGKELKDCGYWIRLDEEQQRIYSYDVDTHQVFYIPLSLDGPSHVTIGQVPNNLVAESFYPAFAGGFAKDGVKDVWYDLRQNVFPITSPQSTLLTLYTVALYNTPTLLVFDPAPEQGENSYILKRLDIEPCEIADGHISLRETKIVY